MGIGKQHKWHGWTVRSSRHLVKFQGIFFYHYMYYFEDWSLIKSHHRKVTIKLHTFCYICIFRTASWRRKWSQGAKSSVNQHSSTENSVKLHGLIPAEDLEPDTYPPDIGGMSEPNVTFLPHIYIPSPRTNRYQPEQWKCSLSISKGNYVRSSSTIYLTWRICWKCFPKVLREIPSNTT